MILAQIPCFLNNTPHLRWISKSNRGAIPVSVTVDAHGMVAIWKDHLGAGLQANAALILPVIISIKLPAAAAGLLAPPFLLAVLVHQVALELLQERVYDSCIPWSQ
jgi:hypothetical protein